MSNSNTNLQTQSSNALHNAIMEAGSKDRPPMLAPGNYVQWKSRIKRYIDTKPNRELIHYSLQNPPYIYQWAEKTVPVAEGSSETTIERYMENYKNVSQDIRDQMNAEAEAVQIILTGIDNDIYSTVDACPNALKCQCPFLLQLPPEWQRFVTLVNKSQDAEDCLLSQAFMTILEANTRMKSMKRTEILARTAIHLHLLLNNKFLSSKPSYTKHSIFLPPPASNSLPETKEKQLFTSSLLLPTYIQTS
ncbi:hypothetical protein Tco_0045549 [Tanacetum coccineum]